MTKVETVYRFPISVFYEPEEFERVNTFMKGFGFDEKIGLSGEAGQTDITLTGEKEITLPEDRIEALRSIIQTGYDKVLKEHDSKFKLTVKKGYKL